MHMKTIILALLACIFVSAYGREELETYNLPSAFFATAGDYVYIAAHINKNGIVYKARIHETNGNLDFSHEALQAVKNWIFKPEYYNKNVIVPIRVIKDYPVIASLK